MSYLLKQKYLSLTDIYEEIIYDTVPITLKQESTQSHNQMSCIFNQKQSHYNSIIKNNTAPITPYDLKNGNGLKIYRTKPFHNYFSQYSEQYPPDSITFSSLRKQCYFQSGKPINNQIQQQSQSPSEFFSKQQPNKYRIQPKQRSYFSKTLNYEFSDSILPQLRKKGLELTDKNEEFPERYSKFVVSGKKTLNCQRNNFSSLKVSSLQLGCFKQEQHQQPIAQQRTAYRVKSIIH